MRDLGDIVLYDIRYSAREASEELAANTSNTMVMLEGLQNNVDYSFFVRAYTHKGHGPWSNKLPFRTSGHCENL